MIQFHPKYMKTLNTKKRASEWTLTQSNRSLTSPAKRLDDSQPSAKNHQRFACAKHRQIISANFFVRECPPLSASVGSCPTLFSLHRNSNRILETMVYMNSAAGVLSWQSEEPAK